MTASISLMLAYNPQESTMGSVVNLECKQAKPQATSGYLNQPLRTEAEVISLLREREKRMPVVLPVDTEPAGGAA